MLGQVRGAESNPALLRQRHLEWRSQGAAKEPRLILVDSSVWIDFFSRSPGAGGRELQRLIGASEPLALSGPIVIEVLQGIGREIRLIEAQLSRWELLEPRGFATYSNAAALVRLARSRGVTLTTIDALVATVALEYGVVLFTLDRDFSRIGNFTELQLHPLPEC